VTSVLDRPAPPPDLTLRYGPLPEHVVDIRFPPAVPGRPAPLIVLIHGGFWRPAYDRTHLGPMGQALTAATHVVSLAGCASLRLCAEWNLGGGAVRSLMGGGPEEVPERYAVADQAALPPPPVPVTLLHGTADKQVPAGMSRAFPTGTLVEIPGAGHFDLIDPQSRAWPRVMAVLAGALSG
jgi:pimeloyl-ACP methyl ester carboxylesterase